MSPIETAREKLRCGCALTIPEAALLLGVAPKTIYNWRSRQRHGEAVPPLEYARYGACVRVLASSVRAMLEPPTRTVAPFVATLRLTGHPGGDAA